MGGREHELNSVKLVNFAGTGIVVDGYDVAIRIVWVSLTYVDTVTVTSIGTEYARIDGGPASATPGYFTGVTDKEVLFDGKVIKLIIDGSILYYYKPTRTFYTDYDTMVTENGLV